jgi:hypothetical protein
MSTIILEFILQTAFSSNWLILLVNNFINIQLLHNYIVVFSHIGPNKFWNFSTENLFGPCEIWLQYPLSLI